MPVFCGIDWAEDHYDVALVDDGGVVLARQRMAVAEGFVAVVIGLGLLLVVIRLTGSKT